MRKQRLVAAATAAAMCLALFASAVRGQAAPPPDAQAEMVITRYGSYPVAANAGNDPVTLPAFHALAVFLLAQPR